jgi:hypothetical protein
MVWNHQSTHWEKYAIYGIYVWLYLEDVIFLQINKERQIAQWAKGTKAVVQLCTGKLPDKQHQNTGDRVSRETMKATWHWARANTCAGWDLRRCKQRCLGLPPSADQGLWEKRGRGATGPCMTWSQKSHQPCRHTLLACHKTLSPAHSEGALNQNNLLKGGVSMNLQTCPKPITQRVYSWPPEDPKKKK